MANKTEAVAKIKLFEIEGLSDGTRRFQSQLYVGSDTADFVMESDEIMTHYGHGKKGFDFYPFAGEYEIVANKSDMNIQIL